MLRATVLDPELSHQHLLYGEEIIGGGLGLVRGPGIATTRRGSTETIAEAAAEVAAGIENERTRAEAGVGAEAIRRATATETVIIGRRIRSQETNRARRPSQGPSPSQSQRQRIIKSAETGAARQTEVKP